MLFLILVHQISGFPPTHAGPPPVLSTKLTKVDLVQPSRKMELATKLNTDPVESKDFYPMMLLLLMELKLE